MLYKSSVYIGDTATSFKSGYTLYIYIRILYVFYTSNQIIFAKLPSFYAGES